MIPVIPFKHLRATPENQSGSVWVQQAISALLDEFRFASRQRTRGQDRTHQFVSRQPLAFLCGLQSQFACAAKRRIYLFRGEYIFNLEKAVVVEMPQLGHATYVFAKPRSMEGFLVLYTKTVKEDIRRNRDNVGERLGFPGRVIHGGNPRAWLKEIRQRLGEKLDFASATAE